MENTDMSDDSDEEEIYYSCEEELPDVDDPENNYYRLVVLIVAIASEVVRQYFRIGCLRNKTFIEFLDRNKHIILHLCKSNRCCKCTDTLKREKILTEEQIKALYKFDPRKRNGSHSRSGKQICICPYETIKTIHLDVLDLSLARAIILNCHQQIALDLGVETWINKIIETRNYVFHQSDMRSINMKDFENRWVMLTGSIEGLAKITSQAYYLEIKQRIGKLQKRVNVSISDDKLKHAVLCHDYWRNKCKELEELRLIDFEQCRKLMKTGKVKSTKTQSQDKLLKKIDVLDSYLDNVLIHVSGNAGVTKIFETKDVEDVPYETKTVSVLFQLDVPDTWNRSNILDAVTQMQRNITERSAIRIKSFSVEDLNILVDIVKNVINTKDKLQQEVHELMSEIVTKAGIDTTELADVNVNMTVKKDGTDTSDLADVRDLRQLKLTKQLFDLDSTHTIPGIPVDGNGRVHVVAALVIQEWTTFVWIVITKAGNQKSNNMYIFDQLEGRTRSLTLDRAVVDCPRNLVHYSDSSIAVLEDANDGRRCISLYDITTLRKTGIPLFTECESSYGIHIVSSFLATFSDSDLVLSRCSGNIYASIKIQDKCSDLLYATADKLFLTGNNQLFCYMYRLIPFVGHLSYCHKLYAIDLTIMLSNISCMVVIEDSLYASDGDNLHRISSQGDEIIEQNLDLLDMSYDGHKRLFLSYVDGHMAVYNYQEITDTE